MTPPRLRNSQPHDRHSDVWDRDRKRVESGPWRGSIAIWRNWHDFEATEQFFDYARLSKGSPRGDREEWREAIRSIQRTEQRLMSVKTKGKANRDIDFESQSRELDELYLNILIRTEKSASVKGPVVHRRSPEARNPGRSPRRAPRQVRPRRPLSLVIGFRRRRRAEAGLVRPGEGARSGFRTSSGGQSVGLRA